MIRPSILAGCSLCTLVALLACADSGGGNSTSDAGASSSGDGGSSGVDAATSETCSDGTRNQDETDVDCGGTRCGKCKDGNTCQSGADCASGACDSATKTCASAPTFTSIAPAQGPTAGGTAVTITGTHFSTSGTVSVKIGGIAATGVTASATTITCSTGASLGKAGLADVVITNPSGASATGKDKYRYIMSTVSAGAPATSPSSSGVFPHAIDLNGDGKLDIVSAQNSDQVSIRLGNGDGTFAPTTYTTAPTFAGAGVHVSTGDINGDGKADLITSDGGGVGIQFGKGDGTFQTGTRFDTGGAWYATLGDLNGDKKLDLITSGTLTAKGVRAFLGNGDGTFQAALPTDIGMQPGLPSLRDINSDGKLDLIVARNIGTDVALGNGDGTFKAPTTVNHGVAGWSEEVADAADLDGDGKLDLIRGGDGGIDVALGNGDGTFKAAARVGSAFKTRGIHAVDLDQDGVLDLVASDYNTGEIRFYHGQGSGTFAAGTVLTTFGAFQRGLGVADLNKDGRPDFFGASIQESLFYVSLGTSN